MTEDELTEDLTRFIRENLMQNLPYEIDEDSPLLELGILDSLKTAILLNYIRDGLGTVVSPMLIDAKNFRSARTIAAMINSLSAAESLEGTR